MIRLADAMLCMDCDAIGIDPTKCEACGSKIVFPLAKWLVPVGNNLLVEAGIILEHSRNKGGETKNGSERDQSDQC